MDARADFGTHNTDEKRGKIPDTVSIRVLSFADITDEMLAEVVDLINNRPGKRLGYLSCRGF